MALANPIPTQLDTGAQAFATLDGGAVSAATPAATLSTGHRPRPSLLASTPDANTTDPYIQEEAAALDYDPTQIFNFLHTQIGYNAYPGSMRAPAARSGRRPAMRSTSPAWAWRLLRASGIPAQYAQGTLSQSQAQQLILSMFPPRYQTLGLPAGRHGRRPTRPTIPSSWPRPRTHYWIQFDTGAGMQDADPLHARRDDRPGGHDGDGHVHRRAQRPRRKRPRSRSSPRSRPGRRGSGSDRPRRRHAVLDQTFDDVALVGHPLTIGNFVNTTSIGALAFSTTTNTYTPYLAVGDEANPDPSQDEANQVSHTRMC